MIGVIATLKIKEGSGKDFEEVASKLVEMVNANEEGVISVSYTHLTLPTKRIV